MEKYLLIANNFMYDAKQFHEASNLIENCEHRLKHDQFLMTPLLYLKRHSIELLIKALILKECSFLGLVNCEWKDIVLLDTNGVSTKRKITQSHSLIELLSYYIFLEESKLATNYDVKECEQIKKIILEFDKTDGKSMTFRYPYSNKKNKREYAQNVSDIAPDIGKKSTVLLYENFGIAFSTSELKYFKMISDLTCVYSYFVKLYG